MTHPRFPIRSLAVVGALAAATVLGACSSTTPASRAAAADDTDTALVLFPGVGAPEQLRSGCWATFYSERNFGGDSLTLVGPVDLNTFDKGTARQLRRDVKSVVTGPRATLTVSDKQFLSSRTVGFQPGTREPGIVEKLGYGGRIESLQLRCPG